MAMGKKLMILTFSAFAASALLLICIAAPAVYFLASSGKSVCVPGLSIRCYESDCGSSFQRCGSNALLKVPAGKVCYRGALLSAARTGLYSCPSSIIANNASRLEDSCPCSSCTFPTFCNCYTCKGGSAVISASGVEYANVLTQNCCLRGRTRSHKPRMWEVALDTARQFLVERFLGQWSLQDFAASFTFQPPSSNSCSCPSCWPGPTCG